MESISRPQGRIEGGVSFTQSYTPSVFSEELGKTYNKQAELGLVPDIVEYRVENQSPSLTSYSIVIFWKLKGT